MSEVKLIATHPEKFHADDVFAVAVLKMIYPRLKIKRTWDKKELSKADFKIDVGKKYNPQTGDFDHHQFEFNETRKNGIPYSSFGLIWKHFGMELINSEEAWKIIDEKIVQPIDARDSGFEIFETKKINPYSIGDFIEGFNENSLDPKINDKTFEKVISVVIEVLDKEIKNAEEIVKARKILSEKINKNKDYIILEKYIPWKKNVINNSYIKFVLFPGLYNSWNVVAVPISENSFKNRRDFPKKWAGLSEKKLQEISGVNDAIFCHKNLFLAVAESKKGAIKLVELALKNKND